MKGERTNWEFHGFSSNPQKSYDAGKKGSVLATQASLKDATNPSAETKTASKVSNQNKPTQGRGWQSPRAGANDAGKEKKSSSEE
ncbi:hypothetical protein ACFSRY_03350 [Pontibacter locisalis]|uniref:Uncharacterized protein n=1 Tax=Pontibacter locisalis TaxID=1719035 RepID=A0ABW5IGY7_9BACT